MNTNELKELKEKFNLVRKDLPRRKRIYNPGGSFDYKDGVSLNDEKFWVEMKDNSIKFFSKECDKVVCPVHGSLCKDCGYPVKDNGNHTVCTNCGGWACK